jgi:cholesterol oxidase
MASFDCDVVIRLGIRRKRCGASRCGEGLPRRGDGSRQAVEGRGPTEEPVAPARLLVVPGRRAVRIQRVEYLDDVLVLCGAGVGGGSHVYANTLYVPPTQFFDAPEWSGITDWADELAPHIDQATRMLGVVRYPYMPTDVDRVMHQVATEMGRGVTFNKAPVGVYFGTPGIEADDPYFGGVGPRRTGCISCGRCNIGCGHNARTS